VVYLSKLRDFATQRLIILTSSILLLIVLYVAPPPISIVASVTLSGAFLGLIIGGFRSSLYSGLEAGILGFLISYLISGGSSLGFNIYYELLGYFGVILPLVYYPLAVGLIAGIVGSIRSSIYRG